MQVKIHNRGPEEAVIHLLPQLWFRNTWSWKIEARKPRLGVAGPGAVEACHHDLGKFMGARLKSWWDQSFNRVGNAPRV